MPYDMNNEIYYLFFIWRFINIFYRSAEYQALAIFKKKTLSK